MSLSFVGRTPWRPPHDSVPYLVIGALGGVVTVDHPGKSPTPAAGVAILLDDYRTVSSDRFGRYRFEDVPTGAHRVSIDPRHLPVDFADGDYHTKTASVELHRTARADFSIRPAAAIARRVALRAEELCIGNL